MEAIALSLIALASTIVTAWFGWLNRKSSSRNQTRIDNVSTELDELRRALRKAEAERDACYEGRAKDRVAWSELEYGLLKELQRLRGRATSE